MTTPQRFDVVAALWSQYFARHPQNAPKEGNEHKPAPSFAYAQALAEGIKIAEPDHYVVDFYRGYSLLCANGAFFYWTGSGGEFETMQGVRDDIDARIAITISAHFD